MSKQKTTIYLASGNPHKLEELSALVDANRFEIRLCKELGDISWVEDGCTFAENAAIKAQAVASMAPEGSWVIADDSGLCVDALDGAPGIFSARYAGEPSDDGQNNRKLLDELKGIQESRRTASFVCFLAVIDDQGHLTSHVGRTRGRILTKFAGKGGFGYDPLFFVKQLNKTYAELSPDEKNTHSHRAKAVASWLNSLNEP